MEQIKKALNIPSIYEAYSRHYGRIGGFEIIIGSLLFSLIAVILSGSTSVIYLVNGLFVPLFFHRFGMKL